MAKVKKKAEPKKVLGVYKLGLDYNWFDLSIDGKQVLSVYDEDVIWQEDAGRHETVAFVKMQKKEGDGLKVKKVRIVGPQAEIKNLLLSLGFATPDFTEGPLWFKQQKEQM